MTTSPAGFRAMLSGMAVLGLVAAAAACDEPQEESVHPVASVNGALIASLKAINGTYGAGCVARAGAWSVRVAGTDPLVNPGLSVENGNVACSLTLTSLVGDETYTAVPPITLTTEYQTTSSALTFGAGVHYYDVNAKLSAASFTSDFIVTLVTSNDTTDIGVGVTSIATSLPAATLHWFGDGAASQGGYDLTARYAPVQEVSVATDWTTLANGGNSSCGTRAGLLYCWGENAQGQLGIGSLVAQNVPTQVGIVTTWDRTEVGARHACALRANNTLWCWGDNADGQLGVGSVVTPKTSPVQVGTSANWDAARTGGSHTCAIRATGTSLYCWGKNTSGQVGMGSTDGPQKNPVLVATASYWKSIATGSVHTCATRTNGTLWCWGDRGSAQLGNGTGAALTTPLQIGTVTTWNIVVAGLLHTCATRTDGTLWCWGNNASGQVGIGSVVSPRTTPIQVGTATNWSGVAAGGNETCATRTDGTLWCWGENTYAQVGIGNVVSPQTSPIQVGTATTWVIPHRLGIAHVCARRTGGSLWCWGRGNLGQLANGEFDTRNVTGHIDTSASWNMAGVGRAHSCATQTNDTLWCWGDNALGQIGIGLGVPLQGRPVQVGAVTNWKGVTAGDSHTCATHADGTLSCWGLNTSGQVGIGNVVSPQATPVQVGLASNWKYAAAGNAHTCATRTDDTLWCWGKNTNGQLGIGSVAGPQTSPVQVVPLAVWRGILAGGEHTCATRADGTLWCWGLNTSGQVGIGSVVSPQTSPVQVGSATNWNLFVGGGGGSHTCITRTDGTLWCWGLNTSGQVGIGSVASPQTSPVQVGSATAWAVAVGGVAHTCARQTLTSHSLWCWGLNTSGQLGLGHYTSPQLTPSEPIGYHQGALVALLRIYAGPAANTTLVME